MEEIEAGAKGEQTEPEIPPDQTTEQDETSETIPRQDNMEVHHHPQLHHKPKPWKEYILEFVMIFLAVTLGFFAENIREHYVENERAEQYAQSLYDDLKVDTATIQRTINEKLWVKAKFDSAKKIFGSGDLTQANEFIYYVERFLRFNDVFSPQDVTYQQLRSSGNFRYISNVALYKNIADYYNLYLRYEPVDGKFGLNFSEELTEIEAKLFNLEDLTSLDNEKAPNYYHLASPSTRKLTPIVNDKEARALLYAELANVGQRTYASILLLEWLKGKAESLIVDLKKEYDLK